MKLASPAQPQVVLRDLAAARATGTLHVGSDPPGLLQLTDGAVSYAASPLVPGVGDLLTIGGRLPTAVWQQAVDGGRAEHRVGAVLVDQGHLTRGELELCVLAVINDAAYFVLVPHAVPVRFEATRPHWLGTVATVPAADLTAEVARRRQALTDILDAPAVDRSPLLPTRRVRRDRIRLTALGWELIVHADGRRTPTGLARHLGRAGYACVREARRLAAEGLVQLPLPAPDRPATAEGEPGAPPPPAAGAPTAQVPAAAEPAAAPPATPPALPPPDRPPPDPAPPDPAPPDPAPPEPAPAEPAAGGGSAARGFRLPRRRPARPRGDAEPVPPADEALLRRLRTALKGMT